MRFKIWLLSAISAIVFAHLVSSTYEENGKSKRDITDTFETLNAKFDNLSVKVEKVEANQLIKNEAIRNDMQRLMSSMEELSKTTQLVLQYFQTTLQSNLTEALREMTSRCTLACSSNATVDVRNVTKADGLLSFNDVRCENDSKLCFRSEDTLYKVFAYGEGGMRWEDANRKCEGEGMRLAMPKDENTTQLLLRELSSRFGSNDSSPGFWVGLKYHKDNRMWQWMDGRALGSYKGGMSYIKHLSDPSCIFLNLRSSTWDHRECTESFFMVIYLDYGEDTIAPNNDLYPLCELRLVN